MSFPSIVRHRLRRRGLISMIIAVVSGLLVPRVLGQQFGQRREFQDGAHVDFKQQLEKGLFARRPEEFAFIARVVTLVDRKQLSRELVTSTFLWARKQPRYPYAYFERGIKVRAARLGITVR